MDVLMIRLALAAVAACLLFVAPAQARSPLDPLAEQYVKLSLEIGEHEDGYIDAYYGPPEWQAAAKARCGSEAAKKGECSLSNLFMQETALMGKLSDLLEDGGSSLSPE